MRAKKLSTQITISQLTILVLTMAIGFGLFAAEERHQLDRQYQGEALAIAQTVAGVPEIRAAMEYGDAGDLVQTLAERIRQNSGAAYVVVIDRNGIRHSHPNPALVGQPITEPVEALDGRTHVGIDPGSLGPSANGKAPLYGPTGTLVGEVSAGMLETEVTGHLLAELPSFALYTALALTVGVAASLLLARRLKRSTFGLELTEIASLLQEREAMLHGIREGVLTADPVGRLTLANDEARRLLPTGDVRLGEPLTDLAPPGRLRDVLTGAVAGADQVVLTGEHCLVVNRMPVSAAGRDLGAVITLRDRTEAEELVRELDSVRGLTDALRAQQHEVANRMHTLAGLLELGDHEEALRYLTETEGLATERAEAVRERIGNPLLVALLLAKTTVAAERGVDLALTADSWLTESCPHAHELVTVLGNLIDNAVDAAHRPRSGPGHRGPRGGPTRGDRPGRRLRIRHTARHLGEDLRRRVQHQTTARATASWPRPGPGAPRGAAAGRDDRGRRGTWGGVHRGAPPAAGRRTHRSAVVIRTLVVDDDYRVAAIHAAYVRRVPGFAVVGSAHSAAEARAVLAADRVQLILLDLYLPDDHGLDLVRGFADLADRPDFIAITAGRDVRNIRAAMQLGAVHYLVKPFRFARLAELLTAYRGVQERLTTLHEAHQDDVDHLYGLLRPPTLPAPTKGHSAPTLSLIRDTLRAADTDMSASEVAAQLGVSRPTAQRYLSYLARHGVIDLLLQYGTTGRPEHRYRYRGTP